MNAVLADALIRLAGAIALETLALVVWNVGTRSPFAALRDIFAALARPRTLVAGSIAFAIGAIFIAAATVLVLPAVADPVGDLLPLEVFMFLVALVLEFLVGSDLRALGTPKPPG